MIGLSEIPNLHCFDQPAMNTLFSLRIEGPDHAHALRTAGACFRELERLESALSRYREGSDVSRINALQAGERLFLEEATYECLKLAALAYQATGGLFDVTLGARIEHRKRKHEGDPPPLTGRIELAPDRPLATCAEPGREIDLGGIGKGYALDRMALLLRDAGVESALLACSGSTMLALGPRVWPASLQGDDREEKIELREQALSASGTGFQGAHILHPDETAAQSAFRRVWVVAASAAMADAFSTAVLLMNEEDIAELKANEIRPLAIYGESPDEPHEIKRLV